MPDNGINHQSVLRAAEEVADLQHDKVPGREHLVEIVRVDLEQDRGHSTAHTKTRTGNEITFLIPN